LDKNRLGKEKNQTFGRKQLLTTPTLLEMGGLGTLSQPGAIIVSADTPVPDPFNPGSVIRHSYKSFNGVQTILDALPTQPGSAGNNSYPNWINDWGFTVGLSANGVPNPINGQPEIHGVLWTPDGRIVDLGSLDGYDSNANAINSFGLVAGWVENRTPDPFSFGEGAETQAFLWQNGVMHRLGTLGGPDSNAFNVNDLGQASGCSLTNNTRNATTNFPTFDAFIWENDKMIDLQPGNFGGTQGCANDLNNHGQVVGSMSLAGDQDVHPFAWEDGRVTDLLAGGGLGGNNGTAYANNELGHAVGFASLPGEEVVHGTLWRNNEIVDIQTVGDDPCSLAQDVNSSDQVVGGSGTCDFSTVLHAVLWENGQIVDLNTLIPPNSGIDLQWAFMINDSGVIAGNGVLTANGDNRAFLLVPTDGDDEDSQVSAVPANRASSRTASGSIITPGAIRAWALAHAASHRIFKSPSSTN
jgi:probable HAF family extracellular repeat protein